MSVLVVENLQKSFGGVRAVDGVTFALDDGEVAALIGPNGAGKSTLFNVIDGQLAADAGHVRYLGRPLDAAPDRRAHPARHRPDVPGRAGLRVDDRAAERAGGAGSGADAAERRRRAVAPPRGRRARAPRPGGPRRTRAGRRRDAGLRRPEAARVRAGAGDRAAAAADGRADRGDGAGRAHGADAPRGRTRSGARRWPCCSPSTAWMSCSDSPGACSCCRRGASSPTALPKPCAPIRRCAASTSGTPRERARPLERRSLPQGRRRRTPRAQRGRAGTAAPLGVLRRRAGPVRRGPGRRGRGGRGARRAQRRRQDIAAAGGHGTRRARARGGAARRQGRERAATARARAARARVRARGSPHLHRPDRRGEPAAGRASRCPEASAKPTCWRCFRTSRRCSSGRRAR